MSKEHDDSLKELLFFAMRHISETHSSPSGKYELEIAEYKTLIGLNNVSQGVVRVRGSHHSGRQS